MDERVKFDDDLSARGKIATSPDVTVAVPAKKKPGKARGKRVKQPVGQQDANALATGFQPVQTVMDDPEADARYSRLMGRLAGKFLGDDLAKEAEGWGKDVFPLLREVLRGRPLAFRVVVGVVIGAPAAISGFKLAFRALQRDEKDQDKDKEKGKKNAAGNP